MLKQLLKYEFKATRNVYGALYLALVLLSVLLGLSARSQNAGINRHMAEFQVILVIIYVAVLFGIAVLCFVNTVQRFYNNLLGREGYLMHTLPVTETQLILSKLIASMVWIICSFLVAIISVTVMVSIGVLDGETFAAFDWKELVLLWQDLKDKLNADICWMMFWSLLTSLAQLAGIILCVYASCMIAHQFKRCTMVVGVVAFVGMNMVENWIVRMFQLDSAVSVLTEQSADLANGIVVTLSGLNTNLQELALDLAFAAVYFFLTRWLMKNKLNLE